ncbi:hypothetical protein [Litchfieldia alkalitelluris]|nr:hypothetical protein [Litchfieldia alkalitelluris]
MFRRVNIEALLVEEETGIIMECASSKLRKISSATRETTRKATSRLDV